MHSITSKYFVPNPYPKDCKDTISIPQFKYYGPGPCNYSSEVMQELLHQPIWFMNEYFYKLMDEIKIMTRYLYQTKNPLTFVAQVSGNGGNEAMVTNLADPGDTVIVAVAGIWGAKVVDMGRRYNLNVIELNKDPGEVYTFEELEKAIVKHKAVTLFVTHAESSTGVLQPLDGLGKMCHKHNCILAVDAVVSVAVVPLLIDEWEIDAVNGASQKGVGAPAGLCLLSFSTRAHKRILLKKFRPPYILDILALADVWNCTENPIRYIYTYGTPLLTSVRQALVEICQEGLENVWKRHQTTADLFNSKLDELGLKNFVEKPENRFCGVICVVLPDNIPWTLLMDYTLKKYRIEFGFGIGPTQDKAVRIGFLAGNAKREIAEEFIAILGEAINYCRENISENASCSVTKIAKLWVTGHSCST